MQCALFICKIRKVKILENRHYKALELDKVLSMLAELTSCGDSREMALSLRPDTNIISASGELKKTEDAFNLIAKQGGPSFGILKNVNNSAARAAAGGVLSARELLDIAEDLRVIRSLHEWRSRQSEEKTLSIDLYFGSLRPNKYLETKITSAIVSEEEISDDASPALADIRRKMNRLSIRIREKLDTIIRSQTYQKCLQDNIITQRNGRFVVPVKAECRGQISGLVHDTSSSGATVFVEPMAVVEANNEIRVLSGKEKDEIERILSELSAEVGNYAEEIKHSYECVLELNLIFAKASLAYKMKATVPELNDCGIVDLKRARHPLLDGKTVVPVDISLGGEFDTLVITGPNTGGKTVSVKTLGLLTLMAMCGLMIPAGEGSKICVFKKIFADIGDEQSIEQSLSTFSSHMVNIVSIIKNADSESLVLIDELGAGTDPVEGAALAMAILERLNSLGAKIAATTHYAELKAYALQTPRVENGSCEFDVSTLKPTYRLLIGVPGRSNAFAISEKLGIDKAVIDRAKELVSTENIRFEDVVDSLEQSRIEMEKEKQQAENLRIENENLRKQAEDRLDEIEKLKLREMDKAKSEALRLVENSKREASAMMLEIDKMKKELKSKNTDSEALSRMRSALKRSLNAVDAASDPISSAAEEDFEPSRPIRVGDDVRIAGTNSRGTVVSVSEKNGSAEVQIGSIKMRAKITDLRLVEKKKSGKGEAVVSRNTKSRLTAASDTRCDLRGMTVDEAIMTLDLFLDSMTMAGLSEVTVIHGKGTGTLRAAVQKHLKSHPQVKSYRLGTFGEGEDGVTIAVLK
ncbi:MAG: endonuclease MutS2 [Clostridiales bacterium]|nr:endonuclease MutS2 [Clostridiales bacterium]